VTGQQLDFNKHCKLEFGAYVQTHEQHDNSMDSRTIGAIALRPTGNTQGGYFFMSLATGRRITRRSWTALPMPQDVIDRVNTIAQQQNVNRGLLFLDRNGLCDDDDLADDADDGADDDDDTYYPPDHTEAEPDDLYYDDTDEPDDLSFGDAPPFAGNPTGVNHNNNDNDEQNNEQNNDGNENTDDNDNNTDNENDNDNDDGNENTDDNDNNTDNENENDNEHNDGNENTDDTDNNNDDDDNNDDSDDEQKMNKLYGPRTSAYDLRPRRPHDYGHLHTTLDGIMMTQHSLKQGLKLYGDDAVKAVLKELKQVHDRKVMTPKRSQALSAQDKRDALQYLMFLKKKRCGTIKGRGCADGRKQRQFITKEDASAPTVAIESVMMSCAIDAKEERDVATVDIPGAFMQADMDEVVHVKLEGTMAELMVRLDPKLYRQYIQDENGKPVLYAKLNKALYGTLRAALLFWKLLSKQLQEWGFIINPYDWCVANKLVKGEQCTVIWHVDDLKISHKDPEVVSSVITMLHTIYRG
jgi:hypothetical protein